jgi:hypothetical protein
LALCRRVNAFDPADFRHAGALSLAILMNKSPIVNHTQAGRTQDSA